MKPTIFIQFMLILLLLAGACAGPAPDSLQEAQAQDIPLGRQIYIDGVQVSGMTIQEAQDALDKIHADALAAWEYQLTAGDKTLTLSATSLPIRFDVDAALSQALALPSYAAAGEIRSLSCQPQVELAALRAALDDAVAPLNQPAQDAQATYDPTSGAFSFTQAEAGRQVDVPALAQALQTAIQSGNRGPIQVPFLEQAPDYTLEQAQAEHQLICQFSTSFAGSTYGKKNRVHNIQKAAELIDGVEVKPGQEFDMNETLGDRNQENGWKEAAGIRDGAYVQEYGGGVCQLSSTLYNAVLMADLTVTERHHHSWPLGYIDPGRDATISTDGPNFRFLNSSDLPVTLSAQVDTDEKTITVAIYGAPLPDGRSIRIRSEKTATLEDLGTEYQVDPSLAPGEILEVRESRRGCIAVTYKEYYDAQGQLIDTQVVTEDKYRSIQGLVMTAS